MEGFKKFLMRGNVVDLAVAVVIGGAFGAIVTAFVKDIITPFIGMFGGIPDFAGFVVTINGSQFLIGDFINQILSFVVIAAVIYFFVVVPMNRVTEMTKKQETAAPKAKACPECAMEIPVAAKKCGYCGATQIA